MINGQTFAKCVTIKQLLAIGNLLHNLPNRCPFNKTKFIDKD